MTMKPVSCHMMVQKNEYIKKKDKNKKYKLFFLFLFFITTIQEFYRHTSSSLDQSWAHVEILDRR
jgi:hypothetical protein